MQKLQGLPHSSAEPDLPPYPLFTKSSYSANFFFLFHYNYYYTRFSLTCFLPLLTTLIVFLRLEKLCKKNMLRAQAFWQKSILGELYSRRLVEKKVWTAELGRERASMIGRRNLETRVVQKGEFITVSRESSTKKKKKRKSREK